MNLSHGKKKSTHCPKYGPTREIRESFPEPRDKAPATFLGHGKSFEARAKRKGSHSKSSLCSGWRIAARSESRLACFGKRVESTLVTCNGRFSAGGRFSLTV